MQEHINDAMQSLEAVVAIFNGHRGPQASLPAPKIGKAYSHVLDAMNSLRSAVAAPTRENGEAQHALSTATAFNPQP